MNPSSDRGCANRFRRKIASDGITSIVSLSVTNSRLWRIAIGVAIALRLILIVAAWCARGPDAFLYGDSPSYLTPASSLAARFEYEDDRGRPEILRPPGYPLLLAFGFVVGHPLLFAIVAQLLLSAAIVALSFEIVRSRFDDRIAGICALLVAIEPTMLLFSVKVMSETLYTALLLAFVAAFLRAMESEKAYWIVVVVSAAALSAAVYVRTIAYPLLVLVPLLLLWKPKRAALFIGTCVLIVAPWHVRNHVRTGYSGFSTQMDRIVYFSAGGTIVARREHRPFVDVREEMRNAVSQSPPAEAGAIMRRTGASLLASDPLGYATTHVAGMMRTLFDPGAVEYLRMFGYYPQSGGALQKTVDAGLLRGTIEFATTRPLAFWASVVMGLLLLPLTVMPLWAMRSVAPSDRLMYFLFAMLIAYSIFASGGVPGASRFRVPIAPLLVMMSSFVLNARQRVIRELSPS
jgi:4-amino-4-deoxy-L-arabinose transferase-like glycosyltransferase